MSATLAAEPVGAVPGRLSDRRRAGPAASARGRLRAAASRWRRRCAPCWPGSRGQRAVLPARRARDPPRPRRRGARRRRTPRSSTCSAGSPPTSRIARRPRIRPAARDPRDQHRRDVADRAGRRHGRRHRARTRSRATTRRGRSTRSTLERVSQASADQRAGRAARLGPGRARRLWDARDRLRPHGEPDIARIDLAGPLLDSGGVGTATPTRSRGSRRRPPRRVAAARALLQRLGALDGGTLTPLGRRLQALPLHAAAGAHPDRAGGARDAARACAMLSERSCAADAPRGDDLRSAGLARRVGLAAAARAPGRAPDRGAGGRDRGRGNAGRITPGPRPKRICAARCSSATPIAWPGAAKRRARRWCWRPGPAPCSGRESGVRDGEFLVALDVQAPDARHGERACLWCASPAVVEPEWIVPTEIVVEHAFDHRSGRVRAWRRERFDRLVLAEHEQRPSRRPPSNVLAEAWLAQEPDDGERGGGCGVVSFAGARGRRADAGPQAAQAGARRSTTSTWPRTPRTRTTASSSGWRPATSLPSGRRTALDVRGGRHRLGGREAAGAVRARRDTARSGRRQTPVVLSAAGAERPSGADHARPAELLGPHLSRGAQGAARPISAASLARGSMDGDADGAREAAAVSRPDAGPDRRALQTPAGPIDWGFVLLARGGRASGRTAARTLCNASLRTASGPEGSSAKQILPCAAGHPGRGRAALGRRVDTRSPDRPIDPD